MMTKSEIKIPKRNVSIFNRITISVLVLGVAAFLTGCLDDNDNPAPQPVALVSVYHASPDAGDLDIVVGNDAINNNPFEYSDYTGYLRFNPGTRNLKFSKAGTADEVLIDTAFQFANNKMYSVFIADSLNSIEAVVLGDSANIPGNGKAMVRIVQLSPDAPVLSVLADDSELFTALNFKDGTAFEEVNAGSTAFEFRTFEGDNATLLTVPAVDLEPKQYYTIVLKGFLTPPDGNENEIDTDIIKL